MSPLHRALASVRDRIAAACARVKRDPETVKVVAVTKTVPAPHVLEALAAGQDLFGENRVQEALGKISEVGPGAHWHLVGSLQKNKARHAVGAFELIHSVDDLELAREIAKRAATAGSVQPVLVQVNLAHEQTKSGTDETGAIPLVAAIRALSNVDVRGLMTIPPPADDPESSRLWFRRLRELRNEAAARTGLPLHELSMGMTDDFEVAVEEGATLVRIGRGIFGERR